MSSIEELKAKLSLLVNDAHEAEREHNINLIIEFQIYMNENDFISDYEWDFAQMAIKFLNSKTKNKDSVKQ